MKRRAAFTMLEMMIAITILSLVIAAIYATWTAILRSSKVGLEAAATVQRERMVARMLEDSLTSSLCFVANQKQYGFVAENGSEPTLSFVARLSKAFPRSGKFGDLDVRRLTFTLQTGPSGSRQLVLRQSPLLMDLDPDEKDNPLVLANNVRELSFQFWDTRMNDWVEEWTQTNQMPKLVMFSLKLVDTPGASKAEELTRIVSLPAVAVQPMWQVPRGMPGMPGGAQPPPGVPGGANPQPGAPSPPGGALANPNFPANPRGGPGAFPR
jgi:prepilin-type N-terminal cleavage/methylation domain-containing protein